MRIQNIRTGFAGALLPIHHPGFELLQPGIAEVALLAYALSLIYQDGFAEIRLKTLGLINANPFS